MSNLISIALGIVIALLGLGLLLRGRRRKPPTPKSTGEIYVPKHEGDLPGW